MKAPLSPRVAVYRLRNSEGLLLYVGSTWSVEKRLIEHKSIQPWWLEVDVSKTEITWYDDRHQAEEAEVAAIINERPLHNSRDAGGRSRNAPAPSDWMSIAEAAKVLGVAPRSIQRTLAEENRRTREWGVAGEGWRRKPLAERKIYQLRRATVLGKAGIPLT